MPVTMYIDSNAHYQDTEYRSGPRVFATLDAALAEARRIVDDCLIELCDRDMTARELFERYMMFGDDPWIVPDDDGSTVPFSAWSYAESRCEATCAETAATKND